MNGLDNRILVKADMDQKGLNNGLSTSLSFNVNYRERRPVLCECLESKAGLKKGNKILVHHNFLYDTSPYQVEDNIFSIKLNQNIFARLDDKGMPTSIFGNVMAERIPVPTTLNLPESYRKNYADRCVIISDGEGFRKGNIVIHSAYSDYEVVYNWKGIERRVIKIKKEDIVGKILKK